MTTHEAEMKLVDALRHVLGNALVKQKTRNPTFLIPHFDAAKLDRVLEMSGYTMQQGDFPNPDRMGCYYVETPDPEGEYILAVIAPDEDTGTFYLEFGGY